MNFNPGDPLLLEHGFRGYGPGKAEGDVDHVGKWYEPAHTLEGRTVTVAANSLTLLSSGDSLRKFVAIRNRGSVTLWVAGPKVAVGSGWNVEPGEGWALDQREYDGDLYGVTAVADVLVTVIDPTTDH